jgi:hypothetical protein
MQMRFSLVRIKFSLVRMRFSLVQMRFSLMRMRFVVRVSDCQCTSCNGPGLGSIPASVGTVESEGQQMETMLNIV